MLITPQRSKTLSGTAYLDKGQGDETLVLVHGVGMALEAWQPQIDQLAQTCRVIAVDLPGHGSTPSLPGVPDLADYVAWFDCFLDELQSEIGVGPANVAGHSMGALIAGGIVATAPHKVKRVALLNAVYCRTPEARQAVEVRACEIGSGDFDRETPMARWFDPNEATTPAYQLVSGLLQSVSASGYAAAYRAFARGDATYADCWANVRCPALFLTADGDLNSTPEMARAMADAAPNGSCVVIRGHRHMVNLTAPDAVTEALGKWLATI